MQNVTTYNGDGDISSPDLTLIGIIVSVVLQILVCFERLFSRVQKSSCRKSADGTIEVDVASKERD